MNQRWRIPHGLLAAWALLGACDDSDPSALDAVDAGGDASADAAWPWVPPGCSSSTPLPSTLECTGLYADIASKQIAAGVEPFTPAVPLWSDGTEKQRWIGLPPGGVIDASNPNEWVFPVGTRLWKQFSVAGRRIETRIWYKVRSNYWVHATYAWNEAQSSAVSSPGGDVPLGAGTYHIPTKDECEKCHRGRTEHILGFEQVGLGLPGAEGLTLEKLVASGRLFPPPASTSLAIGDDGTGAAAAALGWIHANCGTTCHNANSNAVGFAAGMRLRLDPSQLDGRPVTPDFDPLRTTFGVMVNAPNWNGQIRIVPGDPDGSLLYRLISNRGSGEQMPPIATQLVDVEHVALVRDWISKLGPAPADAGPIDAAEVVDAAEPLDVPQPAPPDAAVGEPDAPADPVDAPMGDPDAADAL